MDADACPFTDPIDRAAAHQHPGVTVVANGGRRVPSVVTLARVRPEPAGGWSAARGAPGVLALPPVSRAPPAPSRREFIVGRIGDALAASEPRRHQRAFGDPAARTPRDRGRCASACGVTFSRLAREQR